MLRVAIPADLTVVFQLLVANDNLCLAETTMRLWPIPRSAHSHTVSSWILTEA